MRPKTLAYRAMKLAVQTGDTATLARLRPLYPKQYERAVRNSPPQLGLKLAARKQEQLELVTEGIEVK